ncbi:hypothetical protein C8R44DRAFT_221494 [Mycena epipterygia]|nr:hypothetical protein C8R44DRAFT_221494 [Mycena epipterygia]
MSQSAASEELPAYLQKQIDVSAYVFAGSTEAFIWDILNNLRSDYLLLFKHQINVASSTYITSRIASLVYIPGFTIFSIRRVPRLLSSRRICNSLPLFLPPARDMRQRPPGHHTIRGSLARRLGLRTCCPLQRDFCRVRGPSQCLLVSLKSYIGMAGVMITVYDTLIFFRDLLLPTRELLGESAADAHGAVQSTLQRHQPAHLLEGTHPGRADVQPITVASNIVATLMVYIPSISPVYHGLLVVPKVTLRTIMACRVYRNTKLELARGGGSSPRPCPRWNSPCRSASCSSPSSAAGGRTLPRAPSRILLATRGAR